MCDNKCKPRLYTEDEVKSLCTKAFHVAYIHGYYDEQDFTAQKWIEKNIDLKKQK